MDSTSARHVRGEVLTGSAVESAGRPPAVSGQEGAHMNSGTVPAELVARWQAAYSEYVAMDRMERVEQMSPRYPAKMAQLSAEVAAAWRDLGAVPGLPWWMVASLTTSAEAYQRQAQSWARTPASPGRPTERGTGTPPLHPGETWYRSLDSDGPGHGGGR